MAPIRFTETWPTEPGRYATLGSLNAIVDGVKGLRVWKRGALSIATAGLVTVIPWSEIVPGTHPESEAEAQQIYSEWTAALARVWKVDSLASIGSIVRDIGTNHPMLAKVWRPSGIPSHVIPRNAGRVELFNTHGAGVVQCWDQPACYASIACTPMPTSTPVRCRGPVREIELWECNVKAHKPLSVGVLPVRVRKRTIYPGSGEWSGVYWSSEVELALAEGWDVTPTRRWRYRAGSEIASIVEPLMALRRGPFSKAAKEVANRLIGTISSAGQEWVQITTMHPKKGYKPLYPESGLWLAPNTPKVPPWGRPQVASYLWSVARAKMYTVLKQHHQSVVYCHTDGLWIASPQSGPPQGWELREDYSGTWWSARPGHINVDGTTVRNSGNIDARLLHPYQGRVLQADGSTLPYHYHDKEKP